MASDLDGLGIHGPPGIAIAFSYNDEFPIVLGHLASGRYPTEPWVEHVPFDTHTDAYPRMRAGTIIKAMVDVQPR
jgi:hypothetical protein